MSESKELEASAVRVGDHVEGLGVVTAIEDRWGALVLRVDADNSMLVYPGRMVAVRAQAE